jgi:cytochrome c peroxidase
VHRLFVHRAVLLLALGALVVGSTVETEAARFRSKYAKPHAAPVRATGADSARVALGKALFFDVRLSASGDLSCASCHDPKHGCADTFAVGRGTRGQVLRRRTPTLFEIGHGSIFFWDGRAATLEDQVLGPIQSPQEMDMPLDRLVAIHPAMKLAVQVK